MKIKDFKILKIKEFQTQMSGKLSREFPQSFLSLHNRRNVLARCLPPNFSKKRHTIFSYPAHLRNSPQKQNQFSATANDFDELRTRDTDSRFDESNAQSVALKFRPTLCVVIGTGNKIADL